MGGLGQLADDADAGEGGWGVWRENADAILEQIIKPHRDKKVCMTALKFK